MPAAWTLAKALSVVRGSEGRPSVRRMMSFGWPLSRPFFNSCNRTFDGMFESQLDRMVEHSMEHLIFNAIASSLASFTALHVNVRPLVNLERPVSTFLTIPDLSSYGHACRYHAEMCVDLCRYLCSYVYGDMLRGRIPG